jgi:hypothetical protein
MRIELDVSLEGPCEEIKLEILKEFILGSDYKIISNKMSHILLDSNHENNKFRVHRDGRIYIKKSVIDGELSRDNLLIDMIKDLRSFINYINVNDQIKLKSELNFGFFGKEAYGFFWAKYEELDKIAEELLDKYNLKTYAEDKKTIYIKFESIKECINIPYA